ncbi:hypothetical protein VTN02DRAFT_6689 [Thermoascus thermophilus]
MLFLSYLKLRRWLRGFHCDCCYDWAFASIDPLRKTWWQAKCPFLSGDCSPRALFRWDPWWKWTMTAILILNTSRWALDRFSHAGHLRRGCGDRDIRRGIIWAFAGTMSNVKTWWNAIIMFAFRSIWRPRSALRHVDIGIGPVCVLKLSDRASWWVWTATHPVLVAKTRGVTKITLFGLYGL